MTEREEVTTIKRAWGVNFSVEPFRGLHAGGSFTREVALKDAEKTEEELDKKCRELENKHYARLEEVSRKLLEARKINQT